MKPQSSQIVIWNRKHRRQEVEKVYGDWAMRWVYRTRLGQFLADWILSRAFLSRIYGAYQSTRLSARKVVRFIRDFEIPMEEFESAQFKSFNDFFIRKFNSRSRIWTQVPSELAAFAEARYLAFEKVSETDQFPVKGIQLSALGLLGDAELARQFEGGPLLLARLCPTDYHRFHFPDQGKVLETRRIAGGLHSVNPLALAYRSDIFLTNERQVSLLETQNFGKLAYIEVGALCVGKIVQTHSGVEFTRGQEKGYFLFGGSTVIVMGEPGRWKPDTDLLENTKLGREVLVQLGECVAKVI